MQEAANGPAAAAVDLAEWLVRAGDAVPPGPQPGRGLVRDSVERHVPLAELVQAHPELGAEAVPLLDPGVAVTRRTTPGGAGRRRSRSSWSASCADSRRTGAAYSPTS